jgi:uncharacterized Zn-finger protein
MHPQQIQTVLALVLAGYAAAAPNPAPAEGPSFDDASLSRRFDAAEQAGTTVARSIPAEFDLEARDVKEACKKIIKKLVGKKTTYTCPYCSTSYATEAEAKKCSANQSFNCKMKFRRDELDLEMRDIHELEARGGTVEKCKAIIKKLVGKKTTYTCPYCSTSYNTEAEAKKCSANQSFNCKMKFRRDEISQELAVRDVLESVLHHEARGLMNIVDDLHARSESLFDSELEARDEHVHWDELD